MQHGGEVTVSSSSLPCFLLNAGDRLSGRSFVHGVADAVTEPDDPQQPGS